MNLSTILTPLQADVIARTAAALSPATLTCHTGRRFLAKKVPLPGIVWTYGRDAFGPTRGAHGQNPTARNTRDAGAVAHIQGRTLEETEMLVHAVAAGLYRVCTNFSKTLQSGAWDESEWLEDGEVYELHFSVAMPVTDTIQTVVAAPAHAFDTTGNTPGDGTLEFGGND